jgi:hypothetical protein
MTSHNTGLSAIRSTLSQLVIALPIASAALCANADVTTLTPAADAAIYSQDTSISNGSGLYLFSGRVAGTALRRSLLRFDLSTIPAGSTINSASLVLFMNRTVSGSQNNSLHVLTNDWTEGPSAPGGQEGGGTGALQDDVSWNYRSFQPATPTASPAWNTVGGDYVASPSDTTSVSSSGQPYTWTSSQMASDVQAWLDTPANNFGWILIGNESSSTTTKRFISRQHNNPALHPALTIDYTPPANCLPDVNGDGMVTPTDFTAWINAFNNNLPECDQNGDGSCTPTDFTAWIANFNAGC